MDIHAQAMWDARAQNEPMPLLSATDPEATLEVAYRVQDLLVEYQFGGRPIGAYKAAIVGAGGRTAMGLNAPLTGVLPEDGVLEASEGIVIDLAVAPPRAVETEIGYVFSDTLQTPVADVETLRRHIAAIVPVIEVPGGAVDNTRPSTAADLVAWNINAEVIIVGPRSDVNAVDVDSVRIELRRDGEVINTASGGDAAGGQWQTLLETVNVLLNRGYRMESGVVITNGALGQITRAEVGEYTADYGPLGRVSFRVVDTRNPS
jgi:2-keto-4-pentenoate hydratase